MKNKKAFIWVLRVYELETPVYTKRSNGMLYANTQEEVSIDNIKPVLSDKEFEDMVKNI